MSLANVACDGFSRTGPVFRAELSPLTPPAPVALFAAAFPVFVKGAPMPEFRTCLPATAPARNKGN
ncbi:hypothetical protein NSE01_21400 [Novosphingobium sediminis]|uniref:Uncharacterized protein n=1 Tax=Novosphingobium sediminis TaxID=707214 RepID=A0A512AKU5_9SPHN|nr:hypothetical protein NSE01_21400 [Novosphingobium sediminis]